MEDLFWLNAPIANCYGTPYLRQSSDGKWFLGLEDWNENDEVEISEAFAKAWIAEFKGED